MSAHATAGAPARRPRRPAIAAALSPKRISAVYVLAGLVLLFALWVPDTFLTTTNLKTVLGQQAITGILALGLVVALAAGAFDFSVGATLGVAAILGAWLLGVRDEPVGVAIACALVAGLVVGAVNGLLVTWLRIDSFIATLGMSSILAAATTWISGGDNITGIPSGFQSIATTQLLGVQLPVWYLAALALATWFVLEHTAAGRYLYATGGGAEAARLAGVPTLRITFAALVFAGGVAAFAGILATASLGGGSPTIGPPYLLPALSAVFLGSTQFKPGRVNVWGTILAVYVLATGVKGLQLAGAPFWIPDLFNGLALLLAVGLAVQGRRRILRVGTRRRRAGQSRA